MAKKSGESRASFLRKIAGLPLLSAFPGVYSSSGSKNIMPSIEINGKIPEGKLGNLSITRMIMGSNQINGYAHARDLRYANTLFKAYNTEEKVLETLHLCEQAGINTAFMTNINYPLFNRYKTMNNGKIQSICQTYLRDADFLGDIDKAIGNGADTLYIQGGEGDRYVREGKVAMLGKALEHIKKQGYMAGVGAHSLEVIKTCEKEGLPADYYVKTFHHDRYWSAHPMEKRVEFSVDYKRSEDHNEIHDNMFDLFPVKTTEYMKSLRKPWIAFKVLAGGAILPKDGFRYAFENGADFICVGMFDFQVSDNVNTIIKVLSELKGREREWVS
ncbi:MAG TPA: hypothetical protein VK155_20000 [Bacteroidales bacterium]|nr:hypothetical protein [Bacteroidales bacterium]